MNIKEELSKEHSKCQTAKITAYILEDSERFKILMDIFLNGEYLLAQRAAWVLNYCVENKPSLVQPYLKRMLKNLKNPVHDAVKRNTMRILQFVDIPVSMHGEVINVGFEFLTDNNTAIAVKVFSMTVI